MEIFGKGLCGEVAEWKHPRYPTGQFCKYHKEILELFFPDGWEKITMNEKDLAHDIVVRIVSDLCDRRGLRQAWEEIDGDIQKGIILEWCAIVIEKVRDYEPPERSEQTQNP